MTTADPDPSRRHRFWRKWEARQQQLLVIGELQREASEAAAGRFPRRQPEAVLDAAEAGLMDVEDQGGHPPSAATRCCTSPQDAVAPLPDDNATHGDNDTQEDS